MDSKCTFCGSEKKMIDTPFIELKRDGTHGPKQKPCCNAQAANIKYVSRRFDPSRGEKPDLDEVSKW